MFFALQLQLNEAKSSHEKSLLEKDKECDAKMSDLKKEHELHVTGMEIVFTE